MNKLNFLQQASTGQREVAEKLLQSISFLENRNTVTKFLTNFEQVVLGQIVSYNYSDFKVEYFGGFNDAERKKAKIISNEYYDVDYDIVCLKAEFNNKFNKVEHRNILGAIHNLGINFNRFGDIIVLEDVVYIFVDEEIADFVAMEFTKAGRVNLKFDRVDLTNVQIEKKYEDFEIVSSSFRLDSIVAKITEFLEQDFVKLNHVVHRNGEKICNTDDIISIRKYGRFVVKGFKQNKKSLKYRITISKLV